MNFVKPSQMKHLDAVMDIWVKANIAAHDFIPAESRKE